MSKWSNRKRLATATALCTLGMALPGLAFADIDDKDAECSSRTLRGAYLFAATGFTMPAGVALPKAIVERIDFNGDGTLHVPAATRSINGNVARSNPGDGTYVVNPDCTGTLTFLPSGPNFDIFVSPNGNELTMIQTDPNNVFQGKVTRLR
jgi:hypothetical protein